MPPKTKKAALKMKQIMTNVDIVKQYWPEYPISPESLKNPTREFVIRLYTECAQNLDEKLAFASKTQIVPHPSGLSDEEVLYLKLSRIPSLAEVEFKLGDLFVFDPIRTNTVIYVIMHYLIFTDAVMDKAVQISNAVFEEKDKMKEKEEELIQLKERKLQNEIKLTQVKAERKKLKEEAAALAPEYEATIALIEQSEIKCKDKVEEVEKIKLEIEHLQEEIQKHENRQAQLKNSIVPVEEYAALKKTLESLEQENSNLEEIDHNNGLVEQKEHMQHLQTCLRELHLLKPPDDIYKLLNLRVQLKDEEERLQHDLNFQTQSETEINAMKLELESERNTVEAEKKELQERLRLLIENGMSQEIKLRKKYQQMFENNQIRIKELKRLLEKREADLKRLNKGLKVKYDAIFENQDKVLDDIKFMRSEFRI